MQDIKQRLRIILETTEWSVEDRQWLLAYLDKNDTGMLQQIMQQQFAANIGNGEELNDDKAKQLLEFIHRKIRSAPAKIIRINIWRKIAAVAAIFILLLSGAYLLFFKKNEKGIAKIDQPKPVQNDIAPGGNKAVLTLADNSVIVLDNAQNGTLAQQGNSKISKLDDGQLAYNASGETKEVLYNTISTPKGGQYQMTLSDGSKVWLNAASSIHFPVAFAGKERKVEITGEAYFEVAKNPEQPFKVLLVSPSGGGGGMSVEVLGTHFNINSYADESAVKTTLLEGAVKITKDNNVQMLLPGQQAQLYSNGQILLQKNIDVEEVVAWKNGKFIFNNADIKTIMQQLEKWYDITVEYKSKLTEEQFVGVISRSVNISEILKMLEKTKAVAFEISGKNIIVR